MYVFFYVHVRMCVYVPVCMNICVCTYVCMYICACVHMCVYLQVDHSTVRRPSILEVKATLLNKCKYSGETKEGKEKERSEEKKGEEMARKGEGRERIWGFARYPGL
jgi:hypothetical protein